MTYFSFFYKADFTGPYHLPTEIRHCHTGTRCIYYQAWWDPISNWSSNIRWMSVQEEIAQQKGELASAPETKNLGKLVISVSRVRPYVKGNSSRGSNSRCQASSGGYRMWWWLCLPSWDVYFWYWMVYRASWWPFLFRRAPISWRISCCLISF